MVSEIVIPILDQTTTDVLLLTWLKNEGDVVSSGDVLCEIETDKATMQIETTNAGVLRKILIEPGTTIPPLTIVALVATAEEPLPDVDPYHRVQPAQARVPTPKPDTAPPAKAEQDAPRPIPNKFAVSPRARRLADEHNIDISAIAGSGPRGRILEADVRQALEQTPTAVMSRAAQATAERVSLSWTTIPHFYTSVTVDMSSVIAQQKAIGAGCTYTDFIAWAIAEALAAQPAVNGHWKNGGPEVMAEAHLGLVVQTQHGLVIPTLRDLHNHGLKEIAAARSKLVQQAHEGKLSAVAMTTATFTLSNLGPGHIDHFTAVISPPQLAILTAGSVQPRPLVVDTKLVVRPTATFTLGVDHRAINGRVAAAFLEVLKTSLERET
ncbi:MAG: dihydrolipoamide acetyltransferase family protein [Alphaproteobacteria bacterium]|jgi:pyruvate dehydrogenase E2 component (dihydrolipoamide acetyltransferase)|nr:dihydrolipoamide acetyltransferase family protein [Alphaproteobacteria bacterium]|tara:strand:+ start:11040 stop:12182 length:1143 start_codon:yes stop_codon:yes gene_type:complete